MRATIERFARPVFYLAAAFAFVMAVLPHPPRLPGEPSDKVLHILAFTALGTLASLAFARRSALSLLAGLAVFGAVIEMVQAIPALHRDAELADWIADALAAALAIGVTRFALLPLAERYWATGTSTSLRRRKDGTNGEL